MEDCRTGNLPNYSFIEPRYYALLSAPPNDQHPTHDVSYGERLIARCYQALRTSPAWEHVLFIITYDENGGIYDHVPPPAAVSPDGFAPDGFKFDRYGVRVPAVLISPWIAPGSIVRPPPGAQYPFDHTSIIATLRKLFSLGGPLTARDDAAPDLLHALSLPQPSNAGPDHLPVPMATANKAMLATAASEPPNGMQLALAQASVKLPTGSANAAEHARTVSRSKAPLPQPATSAEAAGIAIANAERFLNGAAVAAQPGSS
jgi:phospholipase C